MNKADPKLLVRLEEILNFAAQDLAKLSSKKMFGCHALWADGNVFALVWKHGRIGVKLPDSEHFEKLMSLKGSDPWKTGPMTIAHWVLVPEAFHEKPAEIKKWTTTAHALCSVLEKKAKPAKKSADKKTATKTPNIKKSNAKKPVAKKKK